MKRFAKIVNGLQIHTFFAASKGFTKALKLFEAPQRNANIKI